MLIRICRDPNPADGNGGGTPPSGTTVQVPNQPPAGAPPAYEPPKLDMATALPPEYRDKPYFKGKDFVSIVKEFDNAQKLIGSRPAGIPAENAAPEEFEKFFSSLKPKDLAQYVLPETEFSKAGKRTPEYEKTVREAMSLAGIHPKQAEKLMSWYEGQIAVGEKMQAEKAAAEKVSRETQFEALLDKTFGAQKQQTLDRVKSIMSEQAPTEHKEAVSKALDGMSNEQLFALTVVIDNIHKNYIAEDNPPGGGAPAGGDPASLQREAEETMRSAAYKDFRDPGHEAARAKVQQLFTRIAGLRK
jgi:hypothetical protein